MSQKERAQDFFFSYTFELIFGISSSLYKKKDDVSRKRIHTFDFIYSKYKKCQKTRSCSFVLQSKQDRWKGLSKRQKNKTMERNQRT
jgi:hypothetical protein